MPVDWKLRSIYRFLRHITPTETLIWVEGETRYSFRGAPPAIEKYVREHPQLLIINPKSNRGLTESEVEALLTTAHL